VGSSPIKIAMISILIPTRNRPENITRLYNSLLETSNNIDDIEVLLYVDNDDNSYDHLTFNKVRGERIVLSEMWNTLYNYCHGDIIMHCGDDIIFRTPNWDTIVKNKFTEFPDNIAFVFGNDGSPHNGNFGTHGFVHRKWVETIGYFVPPYFSSDYNDTWLNDVAKIIGRHIHVDILTEHMHYAFGKGEYDITHQERVERHHRDGVDSIYSSKHNERLTDADKLREVMQ